MRFIFIVLIVVWLGAWVYLGTSYTAMARRRRPLTPPRPCSSQPPSDCHPPTDAARSRHSSSKSTRGSSTSTAGRTATPSAIRFARLRSPSRKRRGSPASSSLSSLTDTSRDLVPSDCGHPTSAPRSHSGSPPRPSTRSMKPVKVPRTQSTLGRATVRVILDRDVDSFILDLPYCHSSQVAMPSHPDVRRNPAAVIRLASRPVPAPLTLSFSPPQSLAKRTNH